MRISTTERRARLAARHHLTTKSLASDPVEAARGVVGLHGSDPTSVYVAAWARTRGLEMAALDDALYEERSLVKILGMRRTMFVVPVEAAPIVDAAATRAIAALERSRTIRLVEAAGIAKKGAQLVDSLAAETLDALRARGEATAAELTQDVPGLREQIPVGEGKTWQGTIGLSTRILFLLSAEGRIIRGRPRGTMVSSLYRWVPIDRWIPGGLPSIPTDEARVDLVRRWLRAFGPGTIGDLRWWTGWTLRDLRKALADIATSEVELNDGSTGLVVADDLESTPEPGPWVALLPALDSTVMGWKERDWYLGAHTARLFDTNGNAGPTIWSGGRIVGGWAQRADGEIVLQLLEDVGVSAVRRIEETAARLASWLGPVRITPRFRTPVEQELVR